MKNKLSLLINPFVRIAGWEAFVIGTVLLVGTTCVGYLNGVCFPGALDVKFTSGLPLFNAIVYQFIGCLSIILVMYIASFVFAKGTRFQDIAGTMVLAHFPYFFISLLGFLSDMQAIANLEYAAANMDIAAMMNILQTNLGLIFTSLLTIPFAIWFIVLLYKAFSVSTGLNGGKAIGIFAGAIILAETISIVAIVLFLKII